MRTRIYSRTNQVIIDSVIVGLAFFAAYQTRYEGQVPYYQTFQFWVLLLPMIFGRQLVNLFFGLGKIPWRYVSIRDVFRIGEAYGAFSLFLVALRYALPASWPIARIPIGVIAVEFLLSFSGALAVRMLRRQLYERELTDNGVNKAARKRRVVLIGAGIDGARVAKQMAMNSSLQIVGFLDDDVAMVGCVIAGVKVLGTSAMLTELVRRKVVDEVLVCIAPHARNSMNRFYALLDGLPVTSKFLPTMTEILDGEDGLRVKAGGSNGNGNSNGVPVIARQEKRAPERTIVQNKTILITGGAGFIGSTIAERLAADNQIILLDRLFEDQPVCFTSLMRNRNVRKVTADIVEGREIDSVVKEADIVFHAAAIVGVGRVCNFPRETLETNFSGTSHVLKALEKSSRLERFVYFSTSEVFGVNSFRVQENTPSAVGPAAEARWSYAIAKLAGEHLVKAYHRQVGMPIVTVRPFNVFGPRRLGAHAVMSFILSALAGNPIEVHGDGSQIRSWCYVQDFCDALIEMIGRPAAIGEDFNIGNPKNTLTIFQLAQKIVELTNSSVPITFTDHAFPDIEIRVPSLGKAREILDFRPAFDIQRGLELTIEWYREHMGFFEARSARTAAKA